MINDFVLAFSGTIVFKVLLMIMLCVGAYNILMYVLRFVAGLLKGTTKEVFGIKIPYF